VPIEAALTYLALDTRVYMQQLEVYARQLRAVSGSNARAAAAAATIEALLNPERSIGLARLHAIAAGAWCP
jgi:hypothetical protein